MFKKYIFLFCIFIFLAISSVSAVEQSNLTDLEYIDSGDDFQINSTLSSTNYSSSQTLNNEADSQINSQSNRNTSVSKLSASDITTSYGKKIKFQITVLDNKNNPVKNQLVNIKVDDKEYDVYSDNKGVASINLNLNAGTYKITYSCEGVSGESTYKVKNYYKITVYKWKSGADVKKNKRIKVNIPNSAVVRKVVKLAKKGTPLIKFKGGNGKKVFITAGVHGSELSSQIAAMRMIKYLTTHPIKGTVYIMPFINPKATAKNIRNYGGVNLNEKANVKGTISYKTVNLIIKFKCSAYGDFHCTKPGGNPGCDVAMGSYKPTSDSAVMAKFISDDSNVRYLIYNKAGVEYKGAMEDVVNLKHIPSVTCEVISPHGKVAKGSCEKSLLMMKSFLKYNGLI